MNYYDNQTYYDILGVDNNATIDIINKAKDRLKFGSPDDRVPFSMWRKIDEAHSVLSNPEKRKEYDEKLSKKVNDSLSNNTAVENKIKSEENVNDILFKEFIIDSLNETDRTKSSIKNPIQNPEKILDINKKQLIKLKRIGKELVLALPTAVIATISIVKKLNKKFKLAQQPGEKITEVKTEESELIEEYRKKLDKKIDTILSQYHHNYDLMVDKIRYENYIELLKKRIELKENQVVKKGELLKYKLQLTALRNQLKTFKLSLEKINDRIKSNNKVQRLSRVYENLEEVNQKLKQNNQSQNKKVIALKKLEVRKENLENKRNLKVQRIKSNREYYAIVKDSILAAHATTENFVNNLLVTIEKIDEKTI